MIVADLDLGAVHPSPSPITGQTPGNVFVEGRGVVVYARGAIQQSQMVNFYITEWQAIGGASANTQTALQYLVKQVEELAGNTALNPVYIQWSATAAGGGAINVATAHDGWYIIESFKPDYDRFVPGGLGCAVSMTVTLVAPGPPGSLAMSYSGGALSTNYSGAAQIAVGYPVAAANQAATAVSRTGGEGAIPLSVAPSSSLNPLPFTPGTLAQLYLGGCRVYDTLSVGGNAVPTGGTFTHASWVQVYGTDHIYTGDVIVTNGLLLLRFQTAAAHACTAYLWSTAQATPGWLSFATLDYSDNAANAGTLRSYTVDRIGLEESRVTARLSTSAGNWSQIVVRLQRGQQFARVDFTPLSQATTLGTALAVTATNNLKIVANSLRVSDVSGGSVIADELARPTDYGYSTAFTNNSSQPFILGLLWQNEVAVLQPLLSGSTVLGTGEAAAYRALILADQPTHYYRLGESAGTAAVDETASQNGVIVNAPTLSVAGAIVNDTNTAITFNGTTQKVTVAGTAGTATGAQPWSLECWEKSSAVSSTLVSSGDTNVAHGGPQIGFDGSGHPLSSDATVTCVSGTVPSSTIFHHIVGTYDGTNLNTYVDGALVAGPTAAAGAAVLGTMRIACRNNAAVDQLFCAATIDEAASYLYALSATQVLAHYNAGVQAGLPTQNATRSYGFYAIPVGTSTTTTDKFQAEAESGALGTGWSSQANAAASGGNEAKCVSGTVPTNADLWGTSFVPPAGVYDLWVRMKVTANTSATVQMQVGLWNSTDSVYVASTTYKPSDLTTSYLWYRVATSVTPTATKNMQVRAVTSTNNLATDFFMDESALVPKTLSTANTGPQEIAQQFLSDRPTRTVRQ